MALTIRIFGRWTARVEEGVWCVLEGPSEVALVLTAIADKPPAGVHVDEQRLTERESCIPDLRVLPGPCVAGRMIH